MFKECYGEINDVINMSHTHITVLQDSNSINLRNIHQFESFLNRSISDFKPVHQDYCVTSGMFPLWSGSVIFLRCHSFYSTEVIEHPNLCDIHLGKEPVVVGGPVDHLWMSAEQSGFSY